MKKYVLYMMGAAMCWMLPMTGLAQDDADSTGLPGDNFDLQGAMELFKKSASPEEFEKALNTESNYVNNLDLNGDNETDYIQVSDRADGKNHAILLQVAVNENELQDVAAILIEQTGDSAAQMQIVGDEFLYGEELVMEPYDEASEKSTGPSPFMQPARIVIVNVWRWPAVHFIYRPAYVPYVSPWRWRAYPVWWRPWHPVYRRVYVVRVRPYHGMYHMAPACYLKSGHNVYVMHKKASPVVHVKYAAPHANYQTQKSAKAANMKAAHGSHQQNGKTPVEKNAASGKTSNSGNHSQQTRGNGSGRGENRGQQSTHGRSGNGGGRSAGNGGGGRGQGRQH